MCSIDDPAESGGVLCCGLSFGIAMPEYNRTWGYVRTFAVP